MGCNGLGRLWARGVVAALAGWWAVASQAGDAWFLMARHGECADVGSLRRKVTDLGEVRDPAGFAALMKRQGYEVQISALPVPRGQAREVRVPARELALVFVTAESCGAGSPRD